MAASAPAQARRPWLGLGGSPALTFQVSNLSCALMGKIKGGHVLLFAESFKTAHFLRWVFTVIATQLNYTSRSLPVRLLWHIHAYNILDRQLYLWVESTELHFRNAVDLLIYCFRNCRKIIV